MKSIVLTLKLEEIKKQRESFQRRLSLLFVFILLLFFSTKSFGQCEMKFEYEVENCSPGKSDGKIYIKMVAGEGPFKFSLYDKYKGGESFTEVSNKISLSRGVRVLLFDNVSVSSYWIQIDNGKCKHVVGGLDGINLTEKN